MFGTYEVNVLSYKLKYAETIKRHWLGFVFLIFSFLLNNINVGLCFELRFLKFYNTDKGTCSLRGSANQNFILFAVTFRKKVNVLTP